MKTFDDVLALVSQCKEDSQKSAAARSTALQDSAAALLATNKADDSGRAAADAHAALVASVEKVNAALAEIVAGDVVQNPLAMGNGTTFAARVVRRSA